MEQYRDRAANVNNAAKGWVAGRRAWKLVRTKAAIESDSIVRRTMRESRSWSEPPRRDSAEQPAMLREIPEAVRFRAKLIDGPHDRAVQGARLLLELAEPESFGEARRAAFPSGASSPDAELALAEAWEQFRHDRYRAVN